MGYQTDQEVFWAGEFGTEYMERNQGPQLLASNLNFFGKALAQAGPIQTCVEFGANLGMNLKALQLLYPGIRCQGVEINPDAAQALAAVIGREQVIQDSILDWEPPPSAAELSLIKGVLIHVNPEHLHTVYQKLYRASRRYVLIAEYYNPSPVSIPYRGHQDRLFKRDFAGEFMALFPDARLVDYGFCYRRDPVFPQDDITWFLIEKKGDSC